MAARLAMVGLSKADAAAMIPAGRVPALMAMGSRDPDFPDAVAEARRFAAQLRADSLITDGSGHDSHAAMPERVVPALLQGLPLIAAVVHALQEPP